MLRASWGSEISPASLAFLIALISANAVGSASASSILFCAASFLAKSSSLPLVLAFHHARLRRDFEWANLGFVSRDEFLRALWRARLVGRKGRQNPKD